MGRLQQNLLTGLVVITPISLTIWFLWTLVGFIDNLVLPLIPENYIPRIDGLNIRGFGVVTLVLFSIVVGWLAKGLLGRFIIRLAERIVNWTPIVRTLYNGLKQIVETIANKRERNFDKACLIEYPRRGTYAVAFVSSTAKGEINHIVKHNLQTAPEHNIISVFLPTTPNPTSGFLLFLPASDVHILDMPLEDAAKLVISAGLVYPPSDSTVQDRNHAAEQPPSIGNVAPVICADEAEHK